MYELTKYNNHKIIYCQFCRKYYYQSNFQEHLQFCTMYHKYLQYINQNKQLQWKPQYSQNSSYFFSKKNYSHNPDSFSNLVKDKRVIIVGPSITVQDCELGNFINQFDVIVRLNRSLPVPKSMYKHIGNRTDILYNSLNTTDNPGENNFHPFFLKRNKVKFLRCPYPPIEPFVSDIKSFYKINKFTKNKINFGHIDTFYYKKLEYNIRTRPYTGTCAIADLLKCGVKQLYVMGIDFYTYRYFSCYRNISKRKLEKLRHNNIHRRRPQIDLIRRFYLLDNRLIVDNILDEILLEKYDKFFNYIKSNVDFNKVFKTGDGFFSKDSLKHKKICIIGDLNESTINSKKYNKMKMLIDLYPYRDKMIREKNITLVYKNISELENDNVHKKILFTQVFKDTFDNKFKKKNYMFMNPLFTKFLKNILMNNIFTRGVLSLEIFIILIYSIFFDETYISNIDPNCNWLEQSGLEKQHYIEERMLFQYLIKRNKIKYL